MSKESRQRLRTERIEREWQHLYKEHVRLHEWDLEQEAERQGQRLTNPNVTEALGLPMVLPQFTIDVLKKAHAYDVIGPKRPKVDRYCDPFGNPPTVLHNLSR